MDKYTATEEAYKNGFNDAMAQFDLIKKDPSSRIAKRRMLWSEIRFCGRLHEVTEAIADELSWRVVMRIVHKLRRKRGVE